MAQKSERLSAMTTEQESETPPQTSEMSSVQKAAQWERQAGCWTVLLSATRHSLVSE